MNLTEKQAQDLQTILALRVFVIRACILGGSTRKCFYDIRRVIVATIEDATHRQCCLKRTLCWQKAWCSFSKVPSWSGLY